MFGTELFIGHDDSEENEHQNGVLVGESISEAVIAAWGTENKRRQTSDDTNNIHRLKFRSGKKFSQETACRFLFSLCICCQLGKEWRLRRIRGRCRVLWTTLTIAEIFVVITSTTDARQNWATRLRPTLLRECYYTKEDTHLLDEEGKKHIWQACHSSWVTANLRFCWEKGNWIRFEFCWEYGTTLRRTLVIELIGQYSPASYEYTETKQVEKLRMKTSTCRVFVTRPELSRGGGAIDYVWVISCTHK